MTIILQAGELAEILTRMTRQLRDLQVDFRTDFKGASAPYLREKLFELELELKRKRIEIKHAMKDQESLRKEKANEIAMRKA